jgi:glycosyltransferase involved in cell wall biosynthesis
MSKVSTFVEVFKSNGPRGIVRTVLEKLLRLTIPKSEKVVHKNKIQLLAKSADLAQAQLNTRPSFRLPDHDGPYHVNWILHPGGESSGGTQNIFRFVKYLEDAGHTCTLYFYATRDFTLEEMYKNTEKNYAKVKAEFKVHNGPMDEADAIFATGWETAYPALNDPSEAQRFYFVQDYEPLFSPVGSEYVFAENTYKFGFHGITAGKWLATTLHNKYKMDCDYYDFGVDVNNYKFTNEKKRNKVFFYARPVTPRRGFEMGIFALSEFHRMHPEVEIVLAGWDASSYDIDFPYTNLSIKAVSELSDVYNECAAALLLSFTNMSLLPLELLACGAIPVMNSGENNSMVAHNPHIVYCDSTPMSLAQGLSEALTREDQEDHARKASESVRELSWEISGEQFCSSFEKVMRG